MTPSENESKLQEVMTALEEGRLFAPEAIEALVAAGWHRALAKETVFIALGGDDIIVTDESGVERYAQSGKTVKEVELLMNGGFILDDSSLEDPLNSRLDPNASH